MTPEPAPTSLLLIVGPIAAGKSTVAHGLAARLRADGRQLAVVELDGIADMARPTLPDWSDARRIFASVTSQWLSAGMDLVIAEGISTSEEVAQVRENVPAGTPILTVVITSSFESAVARALSDPSRGISRQRDFLDEAYRRWDRELPRIAHDLLVDTEADPPEESIRLVLGLVGGVHGA